MSTKIRDIDVLKTWCLSSTLNFTRYIFKNRFNRKFIVGDHHEKIASVLDRVLSGELKRVMINISPRYGKTEVAVKSFIAEGLALNPKAKFIHLSYSDDLARDNSMGVQEIMAMPDYKRLFEARPTSTNSKKWYTEQGGGLYAVSSAGQVTGFGAGLVDEEIDESIEEKADFDEFMPAITADEKFGGAVVIDDPIKPDDALSVIVRDKVNKKFDTTIRNRVNSRNTPIIIIMQRLHEDDLCGYLMRQEPGEWFVLSLPCIYLDESGNEQALWPFKHTLEELKVLRAKNSFVFDTQYMQDPKPAEGLMYEQGFREYEIIPFSKKTIRKAYVDTADTGTDCLCAIIYDETPDANYVIDVLYTQKAMEYSEPKLAEMLTKHQVQECVIESNNGGRSFSRAVEKLCREMGNNKTRFKWFHQTENKAVRIFSHSAAVQNLTWFPKAWDKLWPDFYSAISSYMKVGNNKHDDACFVAGTKVATLLGDKDIDKMKPGDFVITPFGVKKVIDAGCTGVKPVITRLGLTGTENHKIFAGKRFDTLAGIDEKNVSLLSLNNLFIWRYKELLSSTELNTNLWGREDIILANQRTIAVEGVLKDCMLQFGNFIAMKRFQKAFAFTIKMAILSITTILIWSAYRSGNICQNMRKRTCQTLNMLSTIGRCLIKSGKKPVIGIEAKPVRHGIGITQKLKKGSKKASIVSTVVQSLNQSCLMRYFAPTNAAKNTGQSIKELPTHQSANTVEAASRQLKSSRQRRKGYSVPEVVQTGHEQKVYNITVKKDGCYFANGVLVSNCDALTGTVEKRGKTGNKKLSDIL